jgi:hypothetical protein
MFATHQAMGCLREAQPTMPALSTVATTKEKGKTAEWNPLLGIPGRTDSCTPEEENPSQAQFAAAAKLICGACC